MGEAEGQRGAEPEGLWASQSDMGPWESHEQGRMEPNLNSARTLWLSHGKWTRVAPGTRVEATALAQEQMSVDERGFLICSEG